MSLENLPLGVVHQDFLNTMIDCCYKAQEANDTPEGKLRCADNLLRLLRSGPTPSSDLNITSVVRNRVKVLIRELRVCGSVYAADRVSVVLRIIDEEVKNQTDNQKPKETECH